MFHLGQFCLWAMHGECRSVSYHKGQTLILSEYNPCLNPNPHLNPDPHLHPSSDLIPNMNNALPYPCSYLTQDPHSKAIYPELLRLREINGGQWQMNKHAIVASTFGNAFPTNLDRNVPSSSAPPPALVDVVCACLEDGASVEVMERQLEGHRALNVTN